MKWISLPPPASRPGPVHCPGFDSPPGAVRVTGAGFSPLACPAGTGNRTGTWVRSYGPAEPVISNRAASPWAAEAANGRTAVGPNSVMIMIIPPVRRPSLDRLQICQQVGHGRDVDLLLQSLRHERQPGALKLAEVNPQDRLGGAVG